MAQATTTPQQMGSTPDAAAQPTTSKPAQRPTAGQMGQTQSGAPKMGDTETNSGQMGGTSTPLFTDWASI